MDSTTIAVIVTGVLVALLASGVPVALALAVAGAGGIIMLGQTDILTSTLGSAPMSATASYSLTVIPMFILMGVLVSQAGTASALLAFAYRWLRRVPGGLGMAAIAACAGFAAVTGSSIASVATLGRVAVTEMTRFGYQRNFAAGIVGIGGTLGVLIPPSILMVLYGVITGESIGALLLAGIIPGILSAVILAGYIGLRAWRNPELVNSPAEENDPEVAAVGASIGAGRAGGSTSTGPARGDVDDAPGEQLPGLRNQIAGVVKIGVLFVIVVGGIYTGVFTATEAAGIGALAALVFVVADPETWRSGFFRRLSAAFSEAASTTAMIFLILIGAAIFTTFLVRSGVPRTLTESVAGLPVPGLLIVALIVVAMIPLGMFLDGLSIMVLTVPLTYPIITELGFDGIWFGVLMVTTIELGLITPPVGVNAFVLASSVPKLGVEGAFRGLLPFIKVELVIIAIIFAFPWLSTVLPAAMR